MNQYDRIYNILRERERIDELAPLLAVPLAAAGTVARVGLGVARGAARVAGRVVSSGVRAAAQREIQQREKARKEKPLKPLKPLKPQGVSKPAGEVDL